MSELCEILGVRHPILLGPFGGMSSIALTAAVSDAGRTLSILRLRSSQGPSSSGRTTSDSPQHPVAWPSIS